MSHNQIRNEKRKGNQPKGEKQHKKPVKPKAKEERAPKIKSLRQNRDIENEIENLKKAIYAAKQTQEQGREVNTKHFFNTLSNGKLSKECTTTPQVDKI